MNRSVSHKSGSAQERKYRMNLIAAVDNNWAIGNKGRLLVTIPGDHKNFKRLTTGKVVIYGRKTLETFPNAVPLPQRTNMILSRNPSYLVRGAETYASMEALFKRLEDFDSKDVFVIGGESVYDALLDYCDTAYITKINYSYSADAYMPDLSKIPYWSLVEESEEMTCFDIEYVFQTWKQTAVC